jgi:O-antigen/teichoic acid export membrane protein/SAM-dependent methyltransferase
VVLGIPDLRIFSDPYIDAEADRAKGMQVAGRFEQLGFADLVAFYYSLTSVVPPRDARRYTRGLMAAVPRAEEALATWEEAVKGNGGPVPTRLLEVGCGTAPLLVAAAPRFASVIGVDIAFRWLVVAKKRLEEAGLDVPLICACAEALPFPAGAIDRVVLDSTLENVRDQGRALAECHRVVRPAGYLFVSTPNRWSLGPDPHLGLWAGGYLPERWLAAYARRQGAVPPKRRLLSAGALERLIRGSGFERPRLLLPGVPEAQRRHFGPGMRLLMGIYSAVRRLPLSGRVLKAVGPVLHAVSEKPAVKGPRGVGSSPRPSPLGSIARLGAGDLLGKTLNFAAFIYLARTLGVEGYGVLEFARSVLAYFLLLADGGLEVWATREAARGTGIREVVARVVPLRALCALGALGVLLTALPALPDYPALRGLLALFGVTLLVQAVSLKWVFMGQERMTRVAAGLVLSQVVFALGVLGLVRSPEGLLLIPLAQLTADLVLATYFARLFARAHGGLRLPFTLGGARELLPPALAIGLSQGLGLVTFSFDSVLLGFFLGATAVGWYSAAYKPVTMVLAMPITYFMGLFPSLSRAFAESRERFGAMVGDSLGLAAIFAVPVGIGGTFLAEPIVRVLFGQAYAPSAPVLQVLCWSATLVMLRGTFRQACNAAGRPRLDLACAAIATTLNVGLNLLLIPRYGMLGAAAATVTADAVWLVALSGAFARWVVGVSLWGSLAWPAAAGLAMGLSLWLAEPLPWLVRALVALALYFGVVLIGTGSRARARGLLRRASA